MSRLQNTSKTRLSSKNKNQSRTREHKEKPENSYLVLLNKPFNTLCQFTGEENDTTLADFVNIKDVYPAGRLDKDSEGLLLLTNDGALQNRISHPKFKMQKTYWAQVEGEVTEEMISQLRRGVLLNDGKTKPASASILDIESQALKLWARNPPVRFRKAIPTSWIELTISEGKNRQVRRMTAAVGLPTLRLIRVAIGPWKLDELQPGEFKVIDV